MTRSFFFTPEKFRPFYIAIKYNLQKNVPGDKKAIKYKQKFHVYMMFILPFIWQIQCNSRAEVGKKTKKKSFENK